MINKKQLSDEELEKITGGCNGLDDPHYPNFTGYVNMYSLEENKEYYFTEKMRGTVCWYRGIVERTWEQTVIISTQRTHRVRITDRGNGLDSGWSVGDIIEINGDIKAVYTTKIS